MIQDPFNVDISPRGLAEWKCVAGFREVKLCRGELEDKFDFQPIQDRRTNSAQIL